jgi:hypothetical protein
MGSPPRLYKPFRVPSRRLDDRIRELCARAVSADDSDFAAVLSDLRSALHEHSARMREMAMRQIHRLRQPEAEPCTSTSKRMNESKN